MVDGSNNLLSPRSDSKCNSWLCLTTDQSTPTALIASKSNHEAYLSRTSAGMQSETIILTCIRGLNSAHTELHDLGPSKKLGGWGGQVCENFAGCLPQLNPSNFKPGPCPDTRTAKAYQNHPTAWLVVGKCDKRQDCVTQKPEGCI